MGQSNWHHEEVPFVGGYINGRFVSTDAHFFDPHFFACYVLYSDDEGRTWSPPRPLRIVGQITAPLALPDETIIAASNYRLDPPGLRLWRSEDGGASWPGPPIQMWDPSQSRITAEPLAAPGTTGKE